MLPKTKVIQVASAVVRRAGGLLMVQQPDDDGALYWFVPGGQLEHGELATDAVRRELLEETGLRVDAITRLAYTTQIDSPALDRQIIAYVFEATAHHGPLSLDDPDGLTHDVAFVPLTAAVDRLRAVPWAPMREPLLAYLSGAQAGALWQYRERAKHHFQLVGHIA